MEVAEYSLMSAVEDRHWWYLGLHDLVIRSIRDEVAWLGRPLTMLDAGCGTGPLSELMEPFGEVTACDIHPQALAATARRGLHCVLERDLVRDEVGKEQFDLITSIDVLYHRQVTDEAAVLRNLHRALRPQGLLLIQVGAFELLRGSHDLAVHTRRRYRRGELVKLLETAGFAVEFATYRLFPLFLPVLVWRCFTRSFPARDGRASDVARPCPPLVNRLLMHYLKVENGLLNLGLRLPVGTSVFVAARKP